MRRLFPLFLLALTLPSCFLFSDYRRTSFTYNESGTTRTVPLVVPKGYAEKGSGPDSQGNERFFLRYKDGSILYFTYLADTTTWFQEINYGNNLPKELYNALYYKGVDTISQYWRESRMGRYRAGYWNVARGNDGLFDSSLNHFMLRVQQRK